MNPTRSPRFVDRNPPQIPIDVMAELADHHFGVEGPVRVLASERDAAALVGERAVLKVSNVDEDPATVDMQVRALRWLAAVDPSLPVPRVIPTLGGDDTTWHETAAGDRYIVRMVSYLPGEVLEHRPSLSSPATRHHLGLLLGRVNRALAGFFHPAADHEHPWVVMRAPRLRPYTRYIADGDRRTAVEDVLDDFADRVAPLGRRLRHQVVHQDAHIGNVLVDAEDPSRVVGLIDFGDMVHGPLVADLAVAADPDHHGEDLIAIIGDVAAGFDAALPLTDAEVDLLPEFILARLAITVTLDSARRALTPDQPAFLDNEEDQWCHLDTLLTAGPRRIAAHLRRRLGFPPSAVSPNTSLASRRSEVLGQASPFFYRNPLHVERGRGTRLHGADGTPYLDFYNNVPQVGHSHPAVVAAATRQLEALNTNTRYLYGAVVEYADALLATLPPHLDTCLFVNSGSEANDVALQIARTMTGNEGIVITANAYHGVTAATRAVSPSGSKSPPPDHVATVDPPDPYRGRFRSPDGDLAATYAAVVHDAVGELDGRGIRPAALLLDPAMCSDGIPDVPDGYGERAAAIVRRAGGVVIADEVQSGLGRLGVMWGHDARGFEPDLVTMGKPVANGIPMGVVVGRRRLIDGFHRHRGLFSTFGGNPVSCAAARAVLTVIERDGLVANARHMGEYLREGIRNLAGHHDTIGDVRGAGLLVGIDLVDDRASRTPATDAAATLVELLRERRILAGTDGPADNVIKLRPPLTVTATDIAEFLEGLSDALGRLD